MSEPGFTVLAWHFVNGTLRDGSPIPKNGEWLKHDGALKMCESGLHASRSPLDALWYAPFGELTLCRVRCGGSIVEGDDKLVSAKRRIIWRVPADPVLRAFARWCALQVIDKWDTPSVVVEYLRDGNPGNRAAARAAAGAAAWAAAWAAAGDAAGAAAWDAAGAAARAAAGDAARAAARAAAGDAAWAAARAAARAAAGDAAWDAAGAAAWDAQSRQLVSMVMEARKGRTEWVWS